MSTLPEFTKNPVRRAKPTFKKTPDGETFDLARQKTRSYPADEVLGLEGGHIPALARLICLEGSDQASYQKAALHLQEVGGMVVGERQVQRGVNAKTRMAALV